MKIHHITPTLAKGDAVGNNLVAIAHLLENQGYKNDIFCETNLRGNQESIEILDFKDFDDILEDDDVIIYHHSIGTDIVDIICKLKNKIIVIYHNITPVSFLEEYNAEIAKSAQRGRTQLKKLSNAEYFICDSDYNKQDLINEGITTNNIVTIPLLIEFDDYKKEYDKEVYKNMKDGKTNILFVGRVAPNKKQEDVIKSYAYYKKFINTESRLILVGGIGIPGYYESLNKLVQDMGVEDVNFCSHVPFSHILAYYKSADVFLCMSEHEGFCVPLLEAMYFDIPIIAYDATAVPETLGGSSVVVKEKDFPLIAETINEVVTNEELRKIMIEKQRERLKYFDNKKVEKEITNTIIEIIENNA